MYPTANIKWLFVDDNAANFRRSFRKLGLGSTLLPDPIKLQFITYYTGQTPFFEGESFHGTGINLLEPIKNAIREQVKAYKQTDMAAINKEKLILSILAQRDLKRQTCYLKTIGLFQAPLLPRHVSVRRSSETREANDICEVDLRFTDAQSSKLALVIKLK